MYVCIKYSSYSGHWVCQNVNIELGFIYASSAVPFLPKLLMQKIIIIKKKKVIFSKSYWSNSPNQRDSGCKLQNMANSYFTVQYIQYYIPQLHYYVYYNAYSITVLFISGNGGAWSCSSFINIKEYFPARFMSINKFDNNNKKNAFPARSNAVGKAEAHVVLD